MEENKELIAKGDQELSDKDLEAVSGGGMNIAKGQNVTIKGNDNAHINGINSSGNLTIG
jgi:bacteriocin-like protein